MRIALHRLHIARAHPSPAPSGCAFQALPVFASNTPKSARHRAPMLPQQLRSCSQRAPPSVLSSTPLTSDSPVHAAP